MTGIPKKTITDVWSNESYTFLAASYMKKTPEWFRVKN